MNPAFADKSEGGVCLCNPEESVVRGAPVVLWDGIPGACGAPGVPRCPSRPPPMSLMCCCCSPPVSFRCPRGRHPDQVNGNVMRRARNRNADDEGYRRKQVRCDTLCTKVVY